MRRHLRHPTTLMSAVSVGKNATGYSSSTAFDRSNGDVGVTIVSTAGSITVTQQCSIDDSTWYDPVDAAGSALGSVGAAITVTTGRWVSYSPVLAPFIRFKVVEGNVAATVVTIELLFQEEV